MKAPNKLKYNTTAYWYSTKQQCYRATPPQNSMQYQTHWDGPIILMVGTVNLECRASALRGKNLHSLKKPWQQGKTVREEKNPAENTPVQKLIQQRNEHKSPVRQLPPLAPVTGLTFTVLCTVERFPYSIMEGQVHICIFHIRLLKCRCS